MCMKQVESAALCARIVNCLQTILELEPMLRRMDMGRFLLDEFQALKVFLNDVNQIELDEHDVSRIESVTELFLQELKEPMSFYGSDNAGTVTLQ